MAASRKNAIERRLDELAGMWNEFAEAPDARLLRWLADDDSARILDLFIEMQNEEVGEIPDLFISFNEPFDDPDRYGFELRQSLIEQYEDIRSGLAESGLAADWKCPETSSDTGVVAFVRACTSLRKYYEQIMLHLVAVLTPSAVSDSGKFAAWLGELVKLETSPNLRAMVIERSETPILDDLCKAHPERIVSMHPQLDMPGAYAELVREVPGSGPGFEFRRMFVALSAATANGNLAAAKKTADRALKIATEQGWPQMQTVIHLALGSAFFAAGDKAATLACYRSANDAIAGTDDPAAPKLDVQTRFAEASALIADEQFEAAAEVYEKIAPLAAAQKDHFSLLESHRMASYCRHQAGHHKQAWEQGQKALAAGELLDEGARAGSTLPYVGRGLLDLVKDRPDRKFADDVRSRMVALVGEDWEQSLA